MNSKELLASIDDLAKEVKKLSKNKELPEEMVLSLLTDRMREDEGLTEFQKFFTESGGWQNKGRVPNWIKLSVRLMASVK